MSLRAIVAGALAVGGCASGEAALARQAPPPVPSAGGEFERSLPPLDMAAPPPAAIVPAPPAADPALAEPLPPIAGFDVTPAPPPAGITDDQPSTVRYTLAVSGLEQGDLEARFRALSALATGKKDAAAGQIQARADADVSLAERLLRAEGYMDAAATATLVPVPDQPGRLTATIAATPGPLYRLSSVTVTGGTTVPPGLPAQALGLSAGQPIAALPIETGEARIKLRLPEQGYPFVEVGQRDILLDEATRMGAYTLPVDPGPRASYGGFRVEGDPVFTADHVAVLARFRRGQLYDSRKADDLRQALVATSLFSTISVEPVKTGVAGPDGTEAVDLLVRQTKGPWRSLGATAGYGTGEGIKVTGSWTHRNLFPQEGALIVEGVAGTLQQSLSTTFRRSNAGRRDRTVQATAAVARQRFDAYNSNSATLGASISRQSTPLWQKRWTYSLGVEVIAAREDRFQSATQARSTSTFFIAALPGQLGYDRSDSLLDPTQGFRLNGRLSPEVQQRAGGGNDRYARMLFEASAYQRMTGSIVLAGRARVGSIVGASRDAIAPSRRLYSGGGGSVRGFGYQQLGPKDSDDNPVGGRSLTEFAVEARYRFGNFGIVPFVDAGRVGVGSAPSLSGMRYGAGLGGRYYTNFGPVRFDVATPIGRRPGESKVAVYISIGQAF